MKKFKTQFSAKFDENATEKRIIKVEYDLTNATDEQQQELMKRSLNIAFKAKLKRDLPTEELWTTMLKDSYTVDVAELLTPESREVDPVAQATRATAKMTPEQLEAFKQALKAMEA